MLLLALLFAGFAFAPLSVNADPFVPSELVSAPANAGFIFKIASPTENATYSNGTINVSLTVRVVDPNELCENVYLTNYQGDWMQTNASCPIEWDSLIQKTICRQYSFAVTDIPFGEHTINFTAHTQGSFMENNTRCFFELDKTVSTKFFVHANPIVTFLSAQNANSSQSSFPLNFTVDHAVSEMTYSLDGQASASIDGNITLTDLANGQHNITVYATDEYGYTGTSDTLFFNVNPPEFPVLSVAIVSAVSAIAVVSAGLIIYFKKHRR